MSDVDLKAMTNKELTDYILKNRNDDEKVRAAIAEKSSRPGWTLVPADTPWEEQEQILKKLIEKRK